MKISKKEKIMLLVLFVILVSAAYFVFFFQKHKEELANLEENLEAKQLEYDLINARLIASTDLADKIKKNTEKIVKISSKNYGDLKQENQTILIKNLARETGLVINSIGYSSETTTLADLDSEVKAKLAQQLSDDLSMGMSVESKNSENTGGEESTDNTETSEEPVTSEPTDVSTEEGKDYLSDSIVDVLRAEIDFTGSYQDLDKYLKNIYDYKKEIIVSSFSFRSDNPETKQGRLSLAFYGIRDLKHFVSSENLFKKKSSRGSGGISFLPYDTYVFNTQDATSEGDGFHVKDPYEDLSKYEPNVIIRDGGEEAGGTDEVDRDNKRNASDVTLDSFESYDFFFVGTKGVNGDINASTVSYLDSKSAKMSFDFKNPETKNRAYLVFDKNKKMIYSESSEIGLSVYLEKELGDNKIGVVLVDSSGSEYELYFEVKGEKSKWQHISAPCKNEFVYPLMVQRIFVEGEGQNQLMSGTLYFDDLRYKATGMGE